MGKLWNLLQICSNENATPNKGNQSEAQLSTKYASSIYLHQHKGEQPMAHTTYPATLTLIALSLSLGSLAFTPVMTEIDGRSVPEIEWKTTLNKFQFDKDKFFGQRFTAMCPSSSQKASAKKIATHPSTHSICQAGLEAGAIDKKGGLVTVQLNPNGGLHAGSAGATHASSISVVGHADAKAADQIYRDHIQRIKWDTKFTKTNFARKQFIGQRVSFECPKAPSNMLARRIVGTEAYAFSSVICQAAVHAGAITTDGGIVTVQMNPENRKLTGSVRNGIESKKGASGQSALSFVENPVK